MKSRIQLFAVAVLLLTSLVACDRGGSGNPAAQGGVAEQKANAVLDALKQGDLDAALAQYSEGFFATRSPEAWRHQLQAIQDERGLLQKYILRRSQADTRFSGKFYILEYEGFYKGRKRVNHIFTLVLPVEGGAIQLVGHKLTPWEEESEGKS